MGKWLFSITGMHSFVPLQVGQLKGMEKVKVWTDHIILHFWYCASICKENEITSDETALEKMKVCILHACFFYFIIIKTKMFSFHIRKIKTRFLEHVLMYALILCFSEKQMFLFYRDTYHFMLKGQAAWIIASCLQSA